ncbi:DNA repair protein rad10 [Polychaeton citri CBS 116435]|uniref:DNA repair protein rad10 n=1 Tax=Polychaeton citri CBS 116435 TaxID=1314669 RepID=A0A9P4Q3G9_9PEZI|nr:DNA repair protein rad10 [Polychaeton citri CBS 116435]
MADSIQGSVSGATTSNGAPQRTTSATPAQSLDRPRVGAQDSPRTSGVVQPKPQALPKRSGPSSIIVSPRQKGNPILNHVKSLPWEYGDIPADFVLGLTTCALFLQLKYHKLHPEYIYNRIKQLGGRYNLRLVFVLVDIENHEESLKELTKTSLINNVTLILFWSAAEGGRYLELFKTYENAAPTSIKQHQSTTYSDRMVDFVTTPRSINKTDAVSLVSQFGTVRTAVNARHEDVAGIAGWGEKKVERWCKAVREPFRVRKAAKRGLDRETSSMLQSQPISRAATLSRDATRDGHHSPTPTQNPPNYSNTNASAGINLPPDRTFGDTAEAEPQQNTGGRSSTVVEPPSKRKKYADDSVSDGVMAALSKLREKG